MAQRLAYSRRIAPPPGASINKSSALSNGLVAFIRPLTQSPMNQVGGLFGGAWTVSGYNSSMTPLGSGWGQLGTGGGMYGPSINLSAFSIVWFGMVVTYQSTSPFISNMTVETTANTDHFLRFGDATLAKERVQFVTNGVNKLNGTITCPTNTPIVVVATASSSGKRIYVNGVLDASDVTVVTSSALQLGFGYSGYGARGLNGWHACLGVWNRPLSVDEILRISANPWILFSKRVSTMPYTVGTSGQGVWGTRLYTGIGT